LTGTPSYILIGVPGSMEQSSRSSAMGGGRLLVLSGGQQCYMGARLLGGGVVLSLDGSSRRVYAGRPRHRHHRRGRPGGPPPRDHLGRVSVGDFFLEQFQ
jgi:hypothetical protein